MVPVNAVVVVTPLVADCVPDGRLMRRVPVRAVRVMAARLRRMSCPEEGVSVIRLLPSARVKPPTA